MNNAINATKEKQYKRIIIILSVAIPLAVAVLFKVRINGVDLGFLPSIYATINGATAILLIAALSAIKLGKISLHRKLMTACLVLSAMFLVMYVLYHMTSDSTPFGGEGSIRYVYYFILITHIVLSVVVVPLVLFTYLRALLGQYDKHRKLARITFPVWLYVAVTGVIVYFMISPYYA
jgi:putative membrane protein